jgi:hypothetical protein
MIPPDNHPIESASQPESSLKKSNTLKHGHPVCAIFSLVQKICNIVLLKKGANKVFHHAAFVQIF